VAVLGQPNAGKGSFVNYVVGQEVAVVTHRRQTTRNLILGIKNGEDYQIIFMDTPGIHHSKNQLDKYMNKNVRSAVAGADVVLYLFDGTKEMDEEERDYIETLKTKTEHLILVQTKSDKKAIKQNFDVTKISVVNGDNVDTLIENIVKLLPEQECIFDEDYYTDKSVRFLVCEKIRGLLLEFIDKEIPHGVAVEILSFQENEKTVKIEADIVCEREQHKAIIIGKGGSLIKKVGQVTREYVEDLTEKKCVINLFVKVDKDWRNGHIEKYYI
ncbi:MAG: GTPase Era, partial [Clostridia bacterium]|nr:GTPase Era [Clostridia bacterium]